MLNKFKKIIFNLGILLFIFASLEISVRALSAIKHISLKKMAEHYDWQRQKRLQKVDYWPKEDPNYPYLSYIPTAGHERVNSLGFVGKEFSKDKGSNVYRIFCLGGSTTYDGYPAYLEEELKEDFSKYGLKLEVINAGNMGWTSAESFINFCMRCLPLKPDAIIFYEGMNDVEPSFAEHFSPDYSHYRKKLIPNKPVFWDYMPKFLDHSAVYLVIRKCFEKYHEKIRGFVDVTTHYRVTFKEPFHGLDAFRQHLFNLVAVARARGIKIFFLTQFYNKEKLKYPLRIKGCEEANEIVRSFSDYVYVLDITTKYPEFYTYIVDECHFDSTGQKIFAQNLAKEIRPYLKNLITERGDCYALSDKLTGQKRLLNSE